MLFNPFALANVSVLADATVPLMQVQAAATGRRPYFNSKPNFSDSLSVVSKHKTAILWCGWEQSWAMCDAHVFAHPAVGRCVMPMCLLNSTLLSLHDGLHENVNGNACDG